MADPDPNKPQVTDPVTVADLVRVLSVRGSIGVLDVADVIVPTISVGSLSPLEVAVRAPVFSSTDVFSEGTQTAPAAAALLADTGALPAGTYDMMFMCASDDMGSTGRFIAIQHRDAANAATLATWIFPVGTTTVSRIPAIWPMHSFSYFLAQNERLRAVNVITASAGSHYNATIFAVIR